jgi:hypothetical protein
MLRIDKANKALIALERKSMRESGYWERRDIQAVFGKFKHAVTVELAQTEFHGGAVHEVDEVGQAAE